MRLRLDGRARRLLRRLPQTSVYGTAEIVLLTLLAILCARLLWVAVTPVGPLGEWRLQDRTASAVANRAQLLGGFDPFFRLQDGGSAVVTSLQLTLFGTRLDEVTGRGSAIIAGADGTQMSYGVGDEILPGVTLKSVAFDHVTIDRGGAAEQIFIDQSGAVVPPADPGAASSGIDTTLDGGGAVTAAQLKGGIQFLPRTENGRVSGFVLRPGADAGIFRRTGFREGDILVAINGQPVGSAEDAQRLASQFRPGTTLSVNVERGGQVLPIAITIANE